MILGVLKCVVCLCKGCDGCCVFYLYCETWSYRCSYMGSMSVSSCRCCMCLSCVHPVAVLNAAFCISCSLLTLRVQEMTINWGTDLPFLGTPAMRTRWMAGVALHKNRWCRDKSRSDNLTQTSLNLRYLP